MTTPVTKNLEEKNAAYASSFTKGELGLPPSKGYILGALP